MRGTVAKRIFGLFILCALLPIGCLAFFSLREISANLKEQSYQQRHQGIKKISFSLLEGFSFLRAELESLALSYGGPLGKSPGDAGAAMPKLGQNHFLGLTYFPEGSGAEPVFGTLCLPPPRTEAVRTHLESGQPVMFVHRVSGALPRVHMALAPGGMTAGRGVWVGEIHPKYLREIVEGALPPQVDVTVLDSTAGVVYSSRLPPKPVVERVGAVVGQTFSGQFEWGGEGEALLVSYRGIFLKIPYLEEYWIVITNQSKAGAFAPLTNVTRMFVLIVVLTVLVVSLFSVVQIRRTLVPLEKLQEGTKKIGEGKFEDRIEIASGDEFETLAHAFNAMTEQLGAQFRELEETNAKLKQEMEERRQAEKQLLQSQKMEAVGQLTGGIAHDFKNFLTIINGYSAILMQRMGRDDPSRKEIEAVHDAGEQAASLVAQLLEFSRKQVSDPKVVDLNKALSGFDGLTRRLIGNHIDVDVVYGEESSSVRIDPVQLQQVVMNLAVNARDAMPQGGKLTIATSNRDIDGAFGSPHPGIEPGRYVTITVTDTGCGMDENTRSRVFEPFFTTKAPGKGTGLGLSTVYGIVKRNQGHILLESEVGRGTTFTVFLPRAEPPEEERGFSTGSEADRERAGAETLLVAEDDDQVRDLVRSILTTWGYHVLEARDGEESLAIGGAHEGTIHLLLTDVMMPQMNGRELAKRMVEARPGIKILYMSGYHDEGGNGDGMPHSPPAFIRKPFRPGALAQKVREVLDG